MRSLGDTRAKRGCPGHQKQAARAIWQQPKFFRQRRHALRGREGCLAISGNVVTYGAIVEGAGEAVGLIERFGKGKRPRDAFFRQFRSLDSSSDTALMIWAQTPGSWPPKAWPRWRCRFTS